MEAKELFMRYGGSLQMMDRDGVLEEYRDFGITKEQEHAWEQELLSHALTCDTITVDEYRAVCNLMKSLPYSEKYDQLILKGVNSGNANCLAYSWQLIDFSVRKKFLAGKKLKDMAQNVISTLKAWEKREPDMFIGNYVKKWEKLL